MQGSTIDESKVTLNYHQETVSEHHGHPDHRMFGVFVFLLADSMTFLGLFAAFMIYRAIMPAWLQKVHQN